MEKDVRAIIKEAERRNEEVKKQVKEGSVIGSRLGSKLGKGEVKLLPADPLKTISIIEKNEEHKKQMSQIQSSMQHQANDMKEYPEIAEHFQLIQNRINLHLQLVPLLDKILGSKIKLGYKYALLYHAKNLYSQALQVLSGEDNQFSLIYPEWDEYMGSHQHSVQTEAFINYSHKMYKILYHQYERLKFMKNCKTNETYLKDISSLLHDPDDPERSDITASLDILLLGLISNLDKKRQNMKPKKGKQLSPGDLYRAQYLCILCRLANILDIFSMKLVFDEFKLDTRISNAFNIPEEQLIGEILRINEFFKAIK